MFHKIQISCIIIIGAIDTTVTFGITATIDTSGLSAKIDSCLCSECNDYIESAEDYTMIYRIKPHHCPLQTLSSVIGKKFKLFFFNCIETTP